MSDYYKTLGVQRNANEQEIKRAYRQLSLQYHPDRNSSEEAKVKILEINNAYETLSDPEKRKQYDMFGGSNVNSPFQQPGRGQTFHFEFNPMGMGGQRGGPFFHSMGGPGPQMAGMEHIFEQFFGGGGGGANPFEHMFRRFTVRKPPIIQHIIHLTLDQIFTGVLEMDITLERKISIFDPPNALGDIHYLHDEKTELITKKITIPPGLNEGDHIVVEKEGHLWKPFPSTAMEQLPEIVQGDIQFIINVHTHPHYNRNGLDLIYKKKINLAESLCGTQFLLPALGDRPPIPCKIEDIVIFPGMKKMFSGLGLKKDKMFGNLFIEFDVEFPKDLTTKQRELISIAFS
jgi:DnaJ-class molecular chaperone